ncbi:MAG: MaoC family dehydratase [Bradyrhizobiaceae bacterium]|nr:MaoC family dehydratase [Bradyrhizobiaceae bacterium]
MPTFYFEDIAEGAVETFGPRALTREEIIAFAAEYDPQPMHLDEEAAKHTILGGLAASGWHTCCFMMRMMYDYVVKNTASLGSPGVDEVKWRRPLRPGVPLMLRRTILGKRRSGSRPEMGLVHTRWELVDPQGDVVAELTSSLMVAVRKQEAAQ